MDTIVGTSAFSNSLAALLGTLTYMVLHLFTISFPLVRSFEHRVAYATKWKFLWPGMLVTAAFFISWDVVFTNWGIWSFNSDYVVGKWIAGLPLEEWMFFITVPFACVFIYECVVYFLPAVPKWDTWGQRFGYVWAIFLLVIAGLNYDKTYTFVKVGSAGISIILFLLYFGKRHVGHFWIAYLFHLIPFLLVNGVLTSIPVVSYNDAENLGIRFSHITGIPFFHIPIEDSQYSLMLLLMNIGFFEYFRGKAKNQTS